MAGRSPEDAVDAFVERLRRSLSCVVRGVAVASGSRPGVAHGVTLYADGQTAGDPARLRTHSGEGELLFEFKHLYEVQATPDPARPNPFIVRTTFYHYDILDREGNEVVVYHWEPEGISPIRLPHLHVSAAAPIVLPQRPDSALANRRTYLNRLHLLTGRVAVEDVVEVLIREFGVTPLRADWESVLTAGRAENGFGT